MCLCLLWFVRPEQFTAVKTHPGWSHWSAASAFARLSSCHCFLTFVLILLLFCSVIHCTMSSLATWWDTSTHCDSVPICANHLPSHITSDRLQWCHCIVPFAHHLHDFPAWKSTPAGTLADMHTQTCTHTRIHTHTHTCPVLQILYISCHYQSCDPP